MEKVHEMVSVILTMAGALAYLFALPIAFCLVLYTILESNRLGFLASFLTSAATILCLIFVASLAGAGLVIMSIMAVTLSIRLLAHQTRTWKTVVLCIGSISLTTASLVHFGPILFDLDPGPETTAAFLFIMLSPAIFARLIYRSIELRRLGA